MKAVAIVEARMRSSRVPGKVMKTILGKPMLEMLVERLKYCNLLDAVIIATTTNPADDVLEQLACRIGVACFRGSEEDVLDRVLRAAKTANADVIVEITGDCPLMDPAVVDRVVDVYLANNYDYVANRLKPTYPDGFGVRVFSTAALERIANVTDDQADREHVSLYFWEHPDQFSLFNVESGLPERQWNIRLTVDTMDDFLLISNIFNELYTHNPAFSLHDILDLLDRKPALLEINRHVKEKPVR